MKEVVEIDNVRAQILEKALLVFAKYGYSKVSMDDIAKAWGKSRTTLYYYYKNKLEIFEALALKGYKDIIEAAASKTNSSQDIATNLNAYMKYRFDYIIAMISQNENLISDIKDNAEIAKTLFMKLLEDETKYIKRVLKWAIENKEIKPIHQDEIIFLAHVLVTTLRSYEEELIMFRNVKEMNPKSEWLVKILVKGLQ